MSKIMLQPAGENSGAYDHYVHTIENPVHIETIKPYVDKETYIKIQEQYPNGQVYVWGVKSGKNDKTKKQWDKISRGDIILFAKKGGIFSRAVATMKFNNISLAQALWGEIEPGITWENIYLVEDVRNIYIPYGVLNEILEYDEGNRVQGFYALDQEKSERLGLKFDLFTEEICEDIPEQDYRDYVVFLDDGSDLNIERSVKGRKEQSFLRKYLFKDETSCSCGICGRTFPVDMLVTAHIKKRSECSLEEKMDFENIVMPMCKFGCDDLYEKGYIYVKDGQVKLNHKKWSTADMSAEFVKVEGRVCEYYNENTKLYFEAHRKKFGL